MNTVACTFSWTRNTLIALLQIDIVAVSGNQNGFGCKNLFNPLMSVKAPIYRKYQRLILTDRKILTHVYISHGLWLVKTTKRPLSKSKPSNFRLWWMILETA